MSLDFETNRQFYLVPDPTPEEVKFYGRNRKRIYEKILGKSPVYNEDNEELLTTYKEKYNMISFSRDNEDFTFNKTWKIPVHGLTVHSSKITRFTKIPKTVVSIWLQGGMVIVLPVSVVPKGIVSIVFRWCSFPFNGKDLTSLKKLRVIETDNASMREFPKFPKSIEYITFANSSLGLNQKSVDNFKLSNYPKLKYFNVKGSGIKKIPQEWKDAKKLKKLKIFY
jgi:hypothetical protein